MKKVIEEILRKIDKRMERYDRSNKVLLDAGRFRAADNVAEKMIGLGIAREIVEEEVKRDVSEKQTNGDKIRSMTDEELQTILMCPYDTAGKPVEIMPCVRDEKIKGLASPEYCKKCMINWLKQEAEE